MPAPYTRDLEAQESGACSDAPRHAGPTGGGPRSGDASQQMYWAREPPSELHRGPDNLTGRLARTRSSRGIARHSANYPVLLRQLGSRKQHQRVEAWN